MKVDQQLLMALESTSLLMSSTEQTHFDEDEYIPIEERPETYIVPIVFAIIWFVGILGNGTLVIIFMRHRAMRNIPNT